MDKQPASTSIDPPNISFGPRKETADIGPSTITSGPIGIASIVTGINKGK